MINAFELELLNTLQTYWKNVVSSVGTPNNQVPLIFANLPADGDFSANQKAIGELFQQLAVGSVQDDLTFVLQFPAEKTHVPCISIEVGADQEDEVIGSFINQQFDQDVQKAIQYEGGVFTKQYRVGITTFNPDTTLYLYSVIKTAILSLRQSYNDNSTIHIQGTEMVQDAKRFTPDVCYYRYFDLVVEGVIDSVGEPLDTVKDVYVNASITNDMEVEI